MRTITTKRDVTGVVTEKIETVSDTQQNSVKISKNAKGEYSYESKVYADDLEELINRSKLQLLKTESIIKEQSP